MQGLQDNAITALSLSSSRFLVSFTQLWVSKSGQTFPLFALKVLEYLDFALHQLHQISLAQLCAYHLCDIFDKLDMTTIARTTELTEASEQKAEDEAREPYHDQAVGFEKEFYGG